MKKIKHLLALLLAGVITSGCNTITEVGSINGVNIATHTKIGFFSPSLTTSYSYHPDKPGEITREASAASSGTLGQVAGAGGDVGAAALVRPPRTSVNTGATIDATVNGGSTSATGNGGAGQFVPPGHINNPSGNH